MDLGTKVESEALKSNIKSVVFGYGLTGYDNGEGQLLITDEVLDLPILAEPSEGLIAQVTIING